MEVYICTKSEECKSGRSCSHRVAHKKEGECEASCNRDGRPNGEYSCIPVHSRPSGVNVHEAI